MYNKERREELLTEMIHLYGFEHEVVIQFAQIMARPVISDETLETIVKAHKEFPMIDQKKFEKIVDKLISI